MYNLPIDRGDAPRKGRVAFGDGEDDCTNFISQIMVAGGFLQDDTWEIWGYPVVGSQISDKSRGCYGDNIFLNPHAIGGSVCNPAWAITPELRNYLVNNKGFSTTLTNSYQPYGTPSALTGNLNTVLPGDVVFFYSTGVSTQPNHAGIVIGWGPPVDSTGNLDLNAPLIPWIADQSGDGHPRPINDLNGAVDKVEIVHMKYPQEP
ncbi:MAG: amidase domain-containing protein [Anaerolineae bacterium]|nr:amidase domain-containing protein [Anaerolineae bacterium]